MIFDLFIIFHKKNHFKLIIKTKAVFLKNQNYQLFKQIKIILNLIKIVKIFYKINKNNYIKIIKIIIKKIDKYNFQ